MLVWRAIILLIGRFEPSYLKEEAEALCYSAGDTGKNDASGSMGDSRLSLCPPLNIRIALASAQVVVTLWVCVWGGGMVRCLHAMLR